MEKAFCLGLTLGMVGGALIVANNYKARLAVKKSQQEVLDKMDELLDEKLENSENEEKKPKKKSKKADEEN